MTGYDILKRVCGLLGYEGFSENSDDTKVISFWHILNQVLADLNLPEAETLSSVINANRKQNEVIVYGTAMLLAGSLNDTTLANTYTQLYNAKRNGVLCKSDTRRDVIPTPSGGGN